ncbi:MAG: DNA internalization-related competence protein ComEC/Rec2 [Candidatus Aminicenantes bacterium]|nr:DNA internalization-related competence protein ComEC/Rec2 [Candidatus Aminicenantes bacterium]
MTSPFLPLTLALIAGLIGGKIFPSSLSLFLVPFFLSFILAWFFYLKKWSKISFLFIILSFFFFGATYYLLKDKAYESNPLRSLASEDYLDIEGQIEKSPDLAQDRCYLLIKTHKIRFKGEERTIKGRLQIAFPLSPDFSPPKILAGDKVNLSARFLADDDFSNFQEPVSLILMKARGIHRRGYAKSWLLLEKKEPGRLSLTRTFSWLNQQIQAKIKDYFPEDSSKISQVGAFLEALLLGERGRLDENSIRQLQSSGLFHLIAISGAHIAIISYFLFQFWRLFPVSERVRSFILILSLIFYALLVEGRPSVFRATIMTILYLIGRIYWKDTHLLNTLAASAFILLLFNPFQLFEAGFILTFMATLTIIIFFPKIKKFWPILPFRLTDLFILSLAAQLGVIPFTAFIFNRITLASIILNLPAVPLIGVIMAVGWLFLLTTPLSSTLASLIALGLNKLIHLFFGLSRLFDDFQPLSYRIPTPPLIVIVGYFLFLFLLIPQARFRFQKLLIFCGFSLFASFLLFYPFPSSTPYLRLTCLDVGQGEAMLVEFPGKEKMLIDGGGFPHSPFDVGEFIVSPFLWRRGIKKIDYLVLSHAHPDHLLGLKAVVRNFRIGEFWEGVRPSDSKDYDELVASLSPKTKRIHYFRGAKREIAGFTIEFLHPEASKTGPAPISNEDSLVFRLKRHQGLVLFTGDIGRTSEDELLASSLDLRALVLKSAHHGSRTSSSQSFLEAVGPALIIISAGRGNVYEVPHKDILERYEKIGATVLRTDFDGAIELVFQEKRVKIRTSRSRLDILRPVN